MQYGRPIIDSHFHVFSWFDQQGKEFWENTDAYLAGRDFRAVNYCALPSMGNRDVSNNILVALYKLRHPEVYIHGGLIYDSYPVADVLPEGMDPVTQYRELMAIGFDGIKMLETKPTEQKAYGMFIDDAYYDAFFAACEENGTPMVWHVADPETFWDVDRIPQRFLDRGWFYGDGTYMSYDRVYGQVYNVLEKHPKLKVVFAHFFFLSEHPEQLEQMFAKYPGVTVDLTPGSEMYSAFRDNRAYYRDFFIRYQDRILFGTDTSYSGSDMSRFVDRGKAVEKFLTTDEKMTVISVETKGLALPKPVCNKILGENFQRMTGKTPKSMDRTKLKAYVEKYQHLITDEAMLRYIRENI